MPEQQSKAVKQPSQPQLELEQWCRSTSASRFLRDGWQKGASGTIVQRLSAIYLEKVLEIYEKSKLSPGRQHHIWALMHSREAVKHVALESLAYLLGNINDERPYNQICGILGKRAEYVLWLTHPSWGRGLHLQGLRLASNNDLSMGLIRKRLRDKGFRKAAAYRELKHVERAALGAFFVECVAESTRMLEIYVTVKSRRKLRMVRYSQLYWDFLKHWREAATMFRPLFMPMIQPPRPWPGHTGGGYLTIGSTVSSVGWERWPEVSKRMLPCVLGSINLLQEQAYQLDHAQIALTEACWNLGHEIGSLPKRDRVVEPVDDEYKEQGLGPSAYWKAVWHWKSDQRKDGQRSRFINALIAYRRLQEAPSIWFVWHMDHRGRLYSRGAQLNIQGPDHLRTMSQFQERSPIKGHEKAFAWSLGEALGNAPHPEDRMSYLELMSTVVARVGGDPLGNLGYWEHAKEPWRLIQLCRDWHHYLEDPGYCSGTIHWLDQTCSGWGHVACLTGDGTLAQYTNVVGSKPADLYLGVGRLVENRIRWQCEQEHPDRKLKAFEWWRDHKIPRSLWKKVLMPVIYGRSYLSLAEVIKLYLRDEVGDFLTDEGLRVLDLALTLATTVNNVVNEALPHVKDLSRWLTTLSNMQIDAGLRPYWFTPNGLAIECYQSATKRDNIELNLAKRTIRISLNDSTRCKPDKRKTARKLVPDYVHSLDAAFLQRFVAHWGTYKHPISTIHDCFGTTLEHVETLRSELNDQWHRFYSVDHLTRHQGMVEAVLGQEVPAPPLVGTLDRSRIGENRYLFG